MTGCVIEFCCTVRQLDAARATSKRQRRGKGPHRAVMRAEVFGMVGKPLPTSLRDGVPVEVVSTLLGHSSVAVTSSVYGHLTAEDARAALEKAGWFTGKEVSW